MNTCKFNPHNWYSLTYFKIIFIDFKSNHDKGFLKKFPKICHTLKTDYFCESYGR
jgi:hypothetical protein